MNVLPVSDGTVLPYPIRFAPDGRTLAVPADEDRNLVLLDTQTGRFRRIHHPFGYDEPSYAFGLGGAVVVACRTDLARVYDTATGEEVREIPFNNFGLALDVAPDGVTLAVTLPPAIARFDLTTGEQKPNVGLTSSGVGRVAYSADGSRLVTGEGKALKVWPVGPEPAGRATTVLKVTEGGWVKTVALSADGRFAAAVARTTGYLWDTQAKGREPIVFTGRGRSTAAIAFHPSRPLFATAGTDRTVNFWDPATGQQLKKYTWDIGPLTAVAFSPDGLQAVAAGDGRVVVWDVD